LQFQYLGKTIILVVKKVWREESWFCATVCIVFIRQIKLFVSEIGFVQTKHKISPSKNFIFASYEVRESAPRKQKELNINLWFFITNRMHFPTHFTSISPVIPSQSLLLLFHNQVFSTKYRIHSKAENVDISLALKCLNKFIEKYRSSFVWFHWLYYAED